MIAIEALVVMIIAGAIGYFVGRAEVRSTEKRLKEFYKEALSIKDDRITELTLDNDVLRKSLKPPS